MATGTAKPTRPADPSIDAERYIEQQLAKTRLQVRVVDLVSALMALVAASLAFTLVLAVVDHWVLPLAWWGRWLACLALLGGIGYYLTVVVVPLVMRPINPVYAAKAIEESDPTLKNSLINFLLFRRDRGSLHQLVFSALQQRAAADLHRVPIDHAVDRSKVIHFGYLLVGVLAVCAAYTILSPKDPLQSARRVIAPWADIERPTRVRINDVQPGDTTVFQGDTIAVSCTLDGKSNTVTLFFSTTDGEIDEQPVEMKLDADGLRYRCQLPPTGSGLQQSVTYRIAAADAVSPRYRIEVSPAPHITVQRLEYEFPAYTKRPKQTDKSDIKALEGTRVTIHAKANRPIRSAHVELMSDSEERNSRLPMEFRGQEARRTITLALQENRKSPMHHSYQLRFMTDAGRENDNPILHRIEVLPDLPPEVSILTPLREVTEVPQDGSQRIEVRALDPDYGVMSVRLHFVLGGTELLDKALLTSDEGIVGQTINSYEFRPHQFGLQPGDLIVYRATAKDNRSAVGSDSPEPNHGRTRDRQLVIVPPSRSSEAQAGDANSDEQLADNPTDNPQDGSQDADAGDRPGDRDSEPAEKAQANESGKDQQGASSGAKQGSSPGKDEQSLTGGESEAQRGQDGSQGGVSQPGQSGASNQSGGDTGQDESGVGREQGSGRPQGPSEPLHDGEVFEKVLQRLQSQAQNQEQAQNADQQGGTGEASKGKRSPSDVQNGGPGTNKQSDPSTKDSSSGNQARGSSDEPNVKRNEGSSSKQQAGTQTAGERAAQDDDLGAGDSEKGDRSKQDTGASNSGSSGGQKRENTRDAGAAAGADEGNKPEQAVTNRDRPQTVPPDRNQPREKDVTGSTRDQKQSDSQGDSSGDRSGGGSRGAGQGASQAGRETPGQNSAADEGAGTATEPGHGETSSAMGDKQPGRGDTGSSNAEQGASASSRSSPTGSNSGSGEQSPRNSSDEEQTREPLNNNAAASAAGAQQAQDGKVGGGGSTADNESTSNIDELLDVPPGEEANLEYTRRATNMVLEYLKDQQDNPDRELLDELGWSEAELAEFLNRWQQLKQSAAEETGGKRELDESLRSLGLRPSRDRIRQGRNQSDGATGLRDSGQRTAPPPAYQELFDAFLKGAARSTK